MLNILSGIRGTAAALDAERVRMEVISENIANANTARGLDGKPYQRHEVVFENALNQQLQGAVPSGAATGGVRVARITTDQRAPREVYNPGHPDADANGMVALPDINVHEEMVDLITASRAFEADLAVVKHARSMAMETLAIGKHA